MSALSPQQIASLLRSAGFADQEIPEMTAIALAESGGRPNAHNPNAATGDNSYGLLQVNMHGGMGPERLREFGISSNEQLFDPLTNARAAKKIFDSQGFGAWGVYKSGAYRQFLDQARRAAAGPSVAVPTASLADGSPNAFQNPTASAQSGSDDFFRGLLQNLQATAFTSSPGFGSPEAQVEPQGFRKAGLDPRIARRIAFGYDPPVVSAENLSGPPTPLPAALSQPVGDLADDPRRMAGSQGFQKKANEVGLDPMGLMKGFLAKAFAPLQATRAETSPAGSSSVTPAAVPSAASGRPAKGDVIEYLTGDKSHWGYDASHGGDNYHEHLAFTSKERRDAAMAALKAEGIQIGSVNDGRHAPNSYHYSDMAFDVPASQVPVGQERALSRRVREILIRRGFTGL